MGFAGVRPFYSLFPMSYSTYTLLSLVHQSIIHVPHMCPRFSFFAGNFSVKNEKRLETVNYDYDYEL